MYLIGWSYWKWHDTSSQLVKHWEDNNLAFCTKWFQTITHSLLENGFHTFIFLNMISLPITKYLKDIKQKLPHGIWIKGINATIFLQHKKSLSQKGVSTWIVMASRTTSILLYKKGYSSYSLVTKLFPFW